MCASIGLHAAVLFGLNLDMFTMPEYAMAFGQATMEVQLVAGAPAPAVSVAKPSRVHKTKSVAPRPRPMELPPEPVSPPPAPMPDPVLPSVAPVVSLLDPELVNDIPVPQEIESPAAPSPNAISGHGAANSDGPSSSPAAHADHGQGGDEVDLSSLTSPGVAWVKDVRYRKNPPPEYPIKAIVNKIQGLVYLIVDIEPDGNPSAVSVHKSSGSHLLDNAAVKAVWKWEFEPGREGDRFVKSRTRIPIRFELMSRSAAVKSK